MKVHTPFGLDPFVGEAPDDVALTKAPLKHVVCQVKFEPIVSIENSAYVSPFQEKIRHEFPILRKDTGQNINVDASNFSLQNTTIWRFFNSANTTRVSVGTSFVAVETIRYEGREKMLRGLRLVLSTALQCFKPDLVTRVGLRYLNLVSGEPRDDLYSYFNETLFRAFSGPIGARVRNAVTESLFHVDDQHKLSARWGLLEEGSTHDPSILEPIDKRSVILDIDAFSDEKVGFQVEPLMRTVERLADLDYRLFRWMVTPAFLEYYGGSTE